MSSPAAQQSALSTRKACLTGTHRVCRPEETLQRIAPLLPRMGITRLADVTWLDDIGVPVYQAIRPNSYFLSVSQGKGLTPQLAKISAAMESIEGWHAERARSAGLFATVGELADNLGYDIAELTLMNRHYLNPAVRLEWCTATRLHDGSSSYVPLDYIRLDARVSPRWMPRLFETSSNGLASGNTFTEACLHGLYEVVERDALDWTVTPRRLELDTVDGVAGALTEQLFRAGLKILVEALHSPTGFACFRAWIYSEALPAVFEGAGCHLDRDVALCRALTEAVQSRLTTIAGTRDDISEARYERVRSVVEGRTTMPDLDVLTDSNEKISYQEIASLRHPDVTEDLRVVLERVREYTGRDPVVVDHTRPELGIPVVHVVCPGLRYKFGRS